MNKAQKHRRKAVDVHCNDAENDRCSCCIFSFCKQQTQTEFPFCKTKLPLHEFGQGPGEEYLGSDGKWYHKSVLDETYRDGTNNPNFNETGARNTHIELPEGCK